MAETKTFTKAITEFFGKRPGQTLGEFMSEIKALTEADRSYFRAEFAKIGWDVA